MGYVAGLFLPTIENWVYIKVAEMRLLWATVTCPRCRRKAEMYTPALLEESHLETRVFKLECHCGACLRTPAFRAAKRHLAFLRKAHRDLGWRLGQFVEYMESLARNGGLRAFPNGRLPVAGTPDGPDKFLETSAGPVLVKAAEVRHLWAAVICPRCGQPEKMYILPVLEYSRWNLETFQPECRCGASLRDVAFKAADEHLEFLKTTHPDLGSRLDQYVKYEESLVDDCRDLWEDVPSECDRGIVAPPFSQLPAAGCEGASTQPPRKQE